VTVEGTPVWGKSALFAGRRRNLGLGRSSTVGNGFPTLPTDAPGTKGVLWCPRRGTASACANQSACTRRKGDEPLATRADDVLHSVQRPVHVDRHYTPPAKVVGGGAFETRSRSGKPGQLGGTDTELGANGRLRGSPCVDAPAREASSAHREKEGGCGLRPCEDSGPRLGCPHVVKKR
jgi:hypothetical protein